MNLDVELLLVPDCATGDQAAALLRTALDDVGLSRVDFATTVIDRQDLAEQRGFIGSPTILVDGADPFAEPNAAPAVACRLYPQRDGVGRLPDIRTLRQALKRSAAESSSA